MEPPLNNARLRLSSPLLLVRSQSKLDGCTQITEDFAFRFHTVKTRRTSPSFLFPAFPDLTKVLLLPRQVQSRTSSREQQITLSPGFARNPPSRATLPPPSAVRCFSLRDQDPKSHRDPPGPSSARAFPSLRFPSPRRLGTGPRPTGLTLSWSHRTLLRFSSGARFRSRPINSSNNCAAEIMVLPPGRLLTPALAPTSEKHQPLGRRTKPLGPLSSRKASSKEQPIRQNGRRPGTFPACRAPAETRLGPGGDGGAASPARGRDLRPRRGASQGQALTPPRRAFPPPAEP